MWLPRGEHCGDEGLGGGLVGSGHQPGEVAADPSERVPGERRISLGAVDDAGESPGLILRVIGSAKIDVGSSAVA